MPLQGRKHLGKPQENQTFSGALRFESHPSLSLSLSLSFTTSQWPTGPSPGKPGGNHSLLLLRWWKANPNELDKGQAQVSLLWCPLSKLSSKVSGNIESNGSISADRLVAQSAQILGLTDLGLETASLADGVVPRVPFFTRVVETVSRSPRLSVVGEFGTLLRSWL